MDEVVEFLKRLDLFNGVPESVLSQVAQLCRARTYQPGETIIKIREPSENFYLIKDGTVQVTTNPAAANGDAVDGDWVRLTLGTGQMFGEMGLVDKGARSATVRAVSQVQVYAINCQQFLAICDQSPVLGYRVMHNIAADLSFKLRQRNLI